MDTGTFESLIDAGKFIETIETRQNVQIACPEEIAYRFGYITKAEVKRLASSISNNSYGNYILNLLK